MAAVVVLSEGFPGGASREGAWVEGGGWCWVGGVVVAVELGVGGG